MDSTVPESDPKTLLILFAISSIPSWQSLTSADLVLEKLHGMSNSVYKIEVKGRDLEPKAILGKYFGKSSTAFINRALENKRVTFLSLKGLYPKVLVYNDQMRLEEYIPNKEYSYKDSLEDENVLKVMEQFAKLHSVKPDEPIGNPYIDGFISFENPLLMKVLKEVRTSFKLREDQKNKLEKILEFFTEEEILSVRKNFELLNYKFVRFCHNDLFYSNILRTEEDKLLLIDHEYGEHNFFSYDFGNYFQQFAVYFPHSPPYYEVHEENLPSDEKLRLYMAHYLKSYLKLEEISEEQRKEGQSIEVEKLVDDVYLERVLCTVQWVVWAIMMHREESGFDFIDFAYSIYGLHLNARKQFERRTGKSLLK